MFSTEINWTRCAIAVCMAQLKVTGVTGNRKYVAQMPKVCTIIVLLILAAQTVKLARFQHAQMIDYYVQKMVINSTQTRLLWTLCRLH